MSSLESPRIPYWLLAILVAIVFAGASLRFSIAFSDGLWLDELHTAWTTNASIGQVASRADTGNQSPLYFWLVWCCRRLTEVLSTAEPTLNLRLVSLLAGCGAMAVGCHLVWNWTRSYLAVVCVSLLLTVETSLVFYSTEARPYALMQFVALIQVGFFWAWLNQFVERSPWLDGAVEQKTLRGTGIGLAVSTAALVSIHVTSLWLPLCEAIFFASFSCYQVRPSNCEIAFRFRPAWRSAISTALFTAVLLVPSFLELGQNFRNRDNWEPVSDEVQVLTEFDKPLRWGILMPLIGICLLTMSQANFRRSDQANPGKQERRRIMWLIWFVGAWSLVPVGGIWLLHTFNIAPVANARYAQVGAMAIPIFSALAIGWLPRLGQRVALSIFALIGSLIVNPWLLPLCNAQTIPRFRNEDWASTIQEINRGKERLRPVLLFANLLEDRDALSNTNSEFQEFLRFPLTGIPQLDLGSEPIIVYPTLSFQALTPDDVERIRKQDGVWIIIRGNDPLVGEIVSKIFEQVKQNDEDNLTAWSIEFARFEQAPWSEVKLFMISKPRKGL